MAEQRSYWLMKSEPDVYSIEDLAREGETYWDGVRNYQARNFLRDEIKEGDLVLYYHSNAKPPGVAGLAEVTRGGYPDPTQFDPDDPHYDPKAERDEPRWYVVDVAHRATFDRFVPLAELKADDELDGMLVTKRGQRLSVQPVERRHFEHVLELAGWQGEI